MRYLTGVDIGGTNIKIGLLSETHALLASASIPFPHTNAEDMVRRIRQALLALLEQNGAALCDVEALGAVVPGSIDARGETVLNAHNLNFHDVPLRSLFQAQFPELPVYLANDADGAALAELYLGAFRGCRTAVLFTLGTGFGGGVILGGRLFTGGLRQGVELGHMILVDGGEPCTCGNAGCIEAYCSATALRREGMRAMRENPQSLLAQRSGGRAEKIDARMVVDCARADDPAAAEVFERYVDHLASACASVYNILDPEVLAIGGGLCGAGEFLFAPLRELVSKRCFYASHGPLVGAQMGNDAGMIGAALLHRDSEAAEKR